MVAAAAVLLGVVAKKWGLMLLVVVAVAAAVEDAHGNGSPGVGENGTPAVSLVLTV